MSNSLTQRFKDALGRLERDRDVDTIAALFSEDAEVGNVLAPESFTVWTERGISGPSTGTPSKP